MPSWTIVTIHAQSMTCGDDVACLCFSGTLPENVCMIEWHPTKHARHSQHLHVAHNSVTCFMQHPFKFTKLQAFFARHTDIYENKTRLPETTPKTQVSYSVGSLDLNRNFCLSLVISKDVWASSAAAPMIFMASVHAQVLGRFVMLMSGAWGGEMVECWDRRDNNNLCGFVFTPFCFQFWLWHFTPIILAWNGRSVASYLAIQRADSAT